MKIRNGYVSNSSSSSFIVEIKSDNIHNNKIMLSEFKETLLLKYGFKYVKSDSPELAIMHNLFTPCDKNEISDAYYTLMEFWVLCNQEEVSDWLFKNNIPFIASMDNDAQLWFYDGKSNYYEVITNYVQLFCMYHDPNLFKDITPYKKVYF